MKILILVSFITSWAYAQNIDRARLHQEMDALSDTDVLAAPVVEIVKEKPSKKINFAEDNLENDYFNDQVKSKKAAPKRLK